MAGHGRVCPWWLGYLLVNPLRRLIQDPRRVLAPFVREGMTVLEPGCGMGWFTLEIARAVGPRGRVIAVDLQPRMLAGLRARAERAGVLERIELRRAEPTRLGIVDLAGRVDFAFAFYLVHEVPDAPAFLAEIFTALRSGGRLLVVEPRRHVAERDFRLTVASAERTGFRNAGQPKVGSDRTALFEKP